jgi:nicotinamide-nucleotide amidase
MAARALGTGLGAGGRSGPIEQFHVHTFGLPEPEVDRRLKPLARRHTGLPITVLASPLGVGVTITALSNRAGDTGTRARGLFAAARAEFGAHVYAEGDESMESVVGCELLKRQMTLSLAESCTGGLIGHRLTQIPGSSGYVDRGALCYSNEAKHEMVDVPTRLLRRHGAVSAPVAASMASGMRRRSRTHVALSVTGIAGPGGGTETKPVGLVYIGLDARPPRGTGLKSVRITREYRFHGPRDAIKLRASQAALDLLRRWLQGLPLTGS